MLSPDCLFFYFIIFYVRRWSVVATESVLLLMFSLCLITCLLVQKNENFVLSFLYTTHNTSVGCYQLDLGWHRKIRNIKLVFQITLRNDSLLQQNTCRMFPPINLNFVAQYAL